MVLLTSFKRKEPHQYEGFESVQPIKKAKLDLLYAPSDMSDVAALNTKYNDLLDRGAISQETLQANFTGFIENQYQQVLTSAELYYSTNYLVIMSKKLLLFIDLDFPKPWDPSTGTLVLDVQFTKSDGKTAMDAANIPVNYFPFSWFKMVKVMVQNTTTPINNAEDRIREKCLFDLNYNTTKDYKDLNMWNTLSVTAKSTSVACRSNTKTMTDTENLVARTAQYSTAVRDLTSPMRLEIDLATIDKFFAISKLLDPSLKYQLEIVIETEMNRLFEANRQIADDKSPHGTYNMVTIVNKPFVRMSLFGTTKTTRPLLIRLWLVKVSTHC